MNPRGFICRRRTHAFLISHSARRTRVSNAPNKVNAARRHEQFAVDIRIIILCRFFAKWTELRINAQPKVLNFIQSLKVTLAMLKPIISLVQLFDLIRQEGVRDTARNLGGYIESNTGPNFASLDISTYPTPTFIGYSNAEQNIGNIKSECRSTAV